MVRYQFSDYFKKNDQPYNRFAAEGKNWMNGSVHYDYTYRNFHFFGEAALDKKFAKAFVQGLLFSAAPAIDISILYRNFSPRYQSFFSRAFSESSSPTNESGIYLGMSIRPRHGWRIDIYSDHFRFPYLRFRADMPGTGSEHLLQLTYTPAKKTEIYTRFRVESKPLNVSGDINTTSYPEQIVKKNWRTHLSRQLNSNFTVRKRVEFTDVQHNGVRTNGFLAFIDLLYHPMMKPVSGSFRVQHFETDDYNARIYAFENGVTYSYSLPMFYKSGSRYYLTIRYKLDSPFLRRLERPVKIEASLKWAQTFFREQAGSPPASSQSDSKLSDLRLQILFKWQ